MLYSSRCVFEDKMECGINCICAWQATEDQVIKLKDAFGNVTSSVLDDERLQLPIAPVLLSKDLSAAHLGVDLSAGMLSFGMGRQAAALRFVMCLTVPSAHSSDPFPTWCELKLRSTCCAGLWGLDRLDGRSPMRDFKYTSDADGTGVHIYVIDTVTRPYL